MKVKTNYLLSFLMAMLLSVGAFAQARMVSGTVTDDQGETLIGVSVVVVGTTKGTVTDMDGKYSISANDGEVLEFSYVGYEKKDMTVAGPVLNVTLTQGVMINDVVVTALGISREKKALGYAVDQVSSEELSRSGSSNVIASLQGNIAGVQVNSSSGAAGAGMDIVIRGVTSLNPGRSNRPLYIIDGIEMSDAVDIAPVTSPNVSLGLGAGSGTQSSNSNRAADINPDDIESISILKGASATALYGIRAANGAVIITTKTGKKGEPSISLGYTQGTQVVNKFPHVQNQYIDGNRSTSLRRSNIWDSWGAPYHEGAGVTMYDTYRDFYRAGNTNNLSASLTAGNDRFNYRISGNYFKQAGVVPNTDWGKTNFGFKAKYSVSPKLDVGASVIFTKSGGNRPYEGRKSIMNVMAYMSPVVNPQEYHKPYTAKTNFAHGWIDHPLFLSEVNTYVDNVNRYISGINARYKLTDNLIFNYKVGMDNYSDIRKRIVHPQTDEGTPTHGFITDIAINSANVTSNLFVNWAKDLTDDINLSVVLGQYGYFSKKKMLALRGEDIKLDDATNLNQTSSIDQSNYDRRYRNLAGYGEITAGFKNFFYLTVTGRNDWSSTLPKANRSYFFPSVSTSWVLSDMPGFNVPTMSFAKLRASYAVVGKDASPYRIGRYYSLDSRFPFQGQLGYSLDGVIGDENLKPEFTTSLEVGADLRFFKNRFGLDVAFFSSKLKDMILSVPISNTTGASRYYTNAGSLSTKGVEVTTYWEPLKSENFNWKTSINWSKSSGTVDAISDGIDEIVLASSRNVVNKYVLDGKIGDLYGRPFKRSPAGDLIIYSNGLPLVDYDSLVLMGNANPDWVAGWNNELNYKNWGLSFLWEWKHGGKKVDVGRPYTIDNGNLDETLDRYKQVTFKGVNEVTDADGNVTYVKNETPAEITPAGFYRNWKIYRYAPEAHLQDASWIRLRNVNLSYNLPSKWLDKTSFIKGAKITFTGTNLFLNTPFRGWDPESNYFGAGSNIGGYTGLKTPSVKSFLFKFNLTL